MGVPWSAPIDIPMVFSYATAGFAKENTGQMLATYVFHLAIVIVTSLHYQRILLTSPLRSYYHVLSS